MVIMASGIARGRVRTTVMTTVESRKMVVILQIIGTSRLDYEYEIEYGYDFSISNSKIVLVLNLALVVQSEGP